MKKSVVAITVVTLISSFLLINAGCPGANVTESKLTASDAAEDDWFGWSVAVDGNTTVVGSVYDDDNGANAGSAYVFTRSGTTWSEQQKLTASDAAEGDNFGWSVAISGDTVVVGAADDDDNGQGSGSAYIFTRSGTTWNQQQKITASDGAEFDAFAHAVSISGDTVVVGAASDDDNGEGSGSAYIFTRSGITWSEQQKITASDNSQGDYFGSSVSISGDTVTVGAAGDDDNGQDSGSAYVFTRNETTWSEQGKLTATDGTSGDMFGQSISISGDTVVVGADYGDDNGEDSGSAYIFTRSGTIWSEQQKLTAADGAEGDNFGWSVAISGDTVVVGADYGDDNGEDSGSAYVFIRSETTWGQQHKLTASDSSRGAHFGQSVSVSGDSLVVGAPEYRYQTEGEGSGSAYVYGLSA